MSTGWVDKGDGIPAGTPATARRSDPDTSVAAAVGSPNARRFRKSVALAVYELVANAGPAGMTTDEVLDRRPDDDRGTIARRITDLRQAGLVADVGIRRPSRRGCASTAWVATDAGPEGVAR